MHTALIRRRRGGVAPFSPASIFANSEEGIWLDPSDLSTLFQDAAGTTPVTTPGQTVALALDKSQGLVLGPELVTNGGFDSDVSGWTESTGTVSASFDDGRISVLSTGSGWVYQSISVTVGQTYRIGYNFVSRGAGTSRILVGNSIGNAAYINVSTAGSGSVLIVPTASPIFISLGDAAGASTTNIYDDFSLKSLPGNHATQATAAARPTYQVDAGGRGYLSFDGVDDFMVTATITPGTDKVQVFAGVQTLVSTDCYIFSNGNLGSASSGLLGLTVANASKSRFESKGTIAVTAATADANNPNLYITSGLGDISGDTATLRIDGVQAGQSTSDQGTGNYLAYPLYIGARNGTILFFNGRLYSLITRFGPNLDASVIGSAENYVAGKTGISI